MHPHPRSPGPCFSAPVTADQIGATGVAIVATRQPNLPSVHADRTREPSNLADRSHKLTRERRRVVNPLQRHRDLIVGGAPVNLIKQPAGGLVGKVVPANSIEAEQKQVAHGQLSDFGRLIFLSRGKGLHIRCEAGQVVDSVFPSTDPQGTHHRDL